MPADAWVAVTCTSRACLKACPGIGRVMFRRRDTLISIKRNHQAVIVAGVPLSWVCRCGTVWTNPDLARMLELADELARLHA